MNETLDRQVKIVTPEQVELHFRTAGVGSRAAAQLIDWGVLLLFYILLIGAAVEAATMESMKPDQGQYIAAAVIAVVFIVQYAYFWLSEYFWGGRTVGKRAVGLRVIQDNGQPLTFLSSALRNFFRVLDLLPVGYVVGLLFVFFHPQDKRLGDMVAGTIVVYDDDRSGSVKKRKLERVLSRWTPAAIGLDEAARRRLNRDDWAMLSLFVEQLPDLPEGEALKLTGRLAGHLRARMEWREGAPDLGKAAVEFVLGVHREVRDEWEY
ncbi:RDD family protein [Paenibacillus hamazuiensis]|uniref:RDD family protein n=1 Tax=Paenibacillus hamazuiensis TaxID=2936508 RepID=UPI00200C6229|nr:RDD family protein [Paenibacillus hamazuiensis]